MQLHYGEVKCVSLNEDPQFVSDILTPVISFSELSSSQVFRGLNVLNCCMCIGCETPCFCLLHVGKGLEKILQNLLGLFWVLQSGSLEGPEI